MHYWIAFVLACFKFVNNQSNGSVESTLTSDATAGIDPWGGA